MRWMIDRSLFLKPTDYKEKSRRQSTSRWISVLQVSRIARLMFDDTPVGHRIGGARFKRFRILVHLSHAGF